MVRHKEITPVTHALARAMVAMGNTVDRDHIHVREAQTALIQKVTHRLAAHDIIERKAGVVAEIRTGSAGRGPTVVLLPIEAFFFDGRYNLTVDHQRGAVMLTGRDCET